MKRLNSSAIKQIMVHFLYATILILVVLLFVGIYLIASADVMAKRQRKIDSDSDLNLGYFYTPQDVVNCLDTLLKSQNKNLHIVFMGDSIVRNQFTSFMKLIPNYNRTFSSKKPLKTDHYQEDFHVTYQGLLQGFQLSFLWRPLINNTLLSDFKKWNILEDHQVPFIIFLGVSVHHMLDYNKIDGRSFEQHLKQDLIPLLKIYLVTHPLGKLIWLMQPPTLDSQSSVFEELTYIPGIHSDIIRRYNEVTWRALQGTRVLVLEFDSFINEYHRACALTGYQRIDNQTYFDCQENTHPEYLVLLSFTRHILFEHVCSF